MPQWCALECGWIPGDANLLHSISGALMAGKEFVFLLAARSQIAQDSNSQWNVTA